MAEMAFTFALNKLTGQLERGLDRRTGEEVMRMMAEIEDMKVFLNDADARRDREPRVEIWVTQTRRLAYRVEDMLDHHAFRNKRLKILMFILEFGVVYFISFFFGGQGLLGLLMFVPLAIIELLLPRVEPLVRWYKLLHNLRDCRTTLNNVRRAMQRFEFRSTVDTERPNPEPRDGSSLPDTMVGRNKEMERMEELLGDKDQQTQLEANYSVKIIFIVGAVGMGKTTLAAKAYDLVKRNFDCYAFAFVSRPFQPEALLRAMMKSLYDSRSETPPNGMDEMAVETLQQQMAAYLQDKNYMLVVDDVGDEGVWDILKDALPHRSSSSPTSEALCCGKVVFTTRDTGLLSKVNNGRGDQGSSFRVAVHEITLTPLSADDAWTLFLKTALPDKADNEIIDNFLQQKKRKKTQDSRRSLAIPDFVEDIGNKILSKCEGIPLAIKTVGALLSTKEATLDEWQKVLDKLDQMADGSIDNVFVSSGYADLPPVLKRCFLYCSLFPENYEIPKRKLIRMWVAEDFATSTSTSDSAAEPEEAGESQLRKLIERNMLQVARTGLNGEVLSCRVLWLMRSFARKLSVKDEFCTIITSGGGETEYDSTSVITRDGGPVEPKNVTMAGRLAITEMQNSRPKSLTILAESKNSTTEITSIVGDDGEEVSRGGDDAEFKTEITRDGGEGEPSNGRESKNNVNTSAGEGKSEESRNLITNVRGRKESKWDSIRRLAVHSTNAAKLINSEMGASKNLRTFLFFRMNEQQRTAFFSIKELPQKLKLLRVLELQGLRIKKLPPAVGDLLLLRYLGLRGTAITKLHKKILKLEQLQTLDIRDTGVSDLTDMYALKDLRHLLLQGSFSDKVIGIRKGIMWATELQTLAGMKLNEDLTQELGALKNLRKLSIGKVRKVHSDKLCISINRMKQLRSMTLKCDMFDSFDTSRLAPLYHLEKLKLGGRVHEPLSWIMQTTTLTHLYMWNSALENDPLATLQRLPNLVLLSLYDVYDGKTICCDSGGFRRLRKLSILHFGNLEKWVIDGDAMPELQKLFVGYCPKFLIPPEGLENLEALERLQVAKMPREFEDSLQCNSHEHGYKVQHIPQLTDDMSSLSRKLVQNESRSSPPRRVVSSSFHPL